MEIRLEHLVKSFGGTRALDDVSLTIKAGTVRALLGQNGSGKSTLVKILAGFYTTDEGQLWLWDHYQPLPLKSLLQNGIAIIHQDLGLVRNQTALENFCIGSEEWSSYFRPLRWSRERRCFADYCERIGMPELAAKMDRTLIQLRPGERTVVAVMRALRQLDDAMEMNDSANQVGSRSRALILDEPTVFFGEHERAILGQLLRGLTASDVGVLIVTHDFFDVFDFAQSVSVLRDGRLVFEADVSDITEADLVRNIMGREIERLARKRQDEALQEVALHLDDVSHDRLRSINLVVRRKEVVGVTGLVGTGHEDVTYLAAGIRRPKNGTVSVDAGSGLENLAKTGRRCVGFVPSDRVGNGLWLDGSIRENLSIGRIKKFARWGLVRSTAEKKDALQVIDRLSIVASGPEARDVVVERREPAAGSRWSGAG